MNIELMTRYRKNIEISVWMLIIGIGLFVNLSPQPVVQQSQTILNIVILTVTAYTIVYYRFVAPRWSTAELILSSILVYTVFVFLVAHFTGSLQSVLFSLVFVPILITALMLGVQALLIVVAGEVIWLVTEFYFYFLPFHPGISDPHILLWEKLIAILLVSFVAYDNSREIFTRQSEHELLEQEKETIRLLQEREDAILQSMDDMVLSLDTNKNILIANDSFAKTLDISQNEIIGKNYDSLFTIKKTNSVGDAIETIDLTTITTKEVEDNDSKETGPTNFRLQTLNNDKQLFVTLAISNLTVDLKDKETPNDMVAPGRVIVLRDITEELQLERMKIDFVSMAAHELRTPITAIRGYLSALKEEATTSLTPEHNTFLDRADIAANQLTTLMENLLSVSRIEKGAFNLDVRKTDWVHLIGQRVEELANRAIERGLQLNWEPPKENIPEVLVDPLRVSEVFNNILSNAINYTQKGSITISVKYEPAEEIVVTSISDTGPGIPREALNHLFEKFFRVSGVLEQGSKGTGLGLYISKEIIELHKGKIWVESTFGEGTTFSFSVSTIHNLKLRKQFEQENAFRV